MRYVRGESRSSFYSFIVDDGPEGKTGRRREWHEEQRIRPTCRCALHLCS